MPSTPWALSLTLDVARKETRILDIDRVLELCQTKQKVAFRDAQLKRLVRKTGYPLDQVSTSEV
jgi:hypothetical protein